MNASEVQALLQSEFADCDVNVEDLGPGKLLVQLVGARFEGMRRVKREQAAGAPLRDAILDGRIHAVNYQVLTPAERDAQGR